ncbi:hypothetical protein C1645_781280 [Glomus cerebriforme]|uniref:BTB domain-containing protein n=1 Tax=Glomus cerebriforme TaxID=658196 RepID=A0A397SLE8_9GLOM|nr:hypothetical protein C1645_781280 [Glomus cerebriforme]
MSNNFVTKVFKKLNKTPKTQTSYNVIIYIGKEPDCKEFHTDSKTLRSKSDHFKKLLFAKDVEKKDEKYVIKKPNITPQNFNIIIKYLFNEDFNLTDKSRIEILNIIIISDDLKLNQILHKFIPLIKFYGISSEDYFNKIRPYEEILSKELWDEILKFHMIPGYKPTLNVYRLRYSRYYDSKTPAAFHAKCDNKRATIVIVKISNSEQIVGGYNPLQWDSNNAFKYTKDSFIFSSKNSTNFQKAKVFYSNGVGSFFTYDPIFGNYDLAYAVYNNTWQSNLIYYYPKIDIPTTFNASDYEVFQVTQK